MELKACKECKHCVLHGNLTFAKCMAEKTFDPVSGDQGYFYCSTQRLSTTGSVKTCGIEGRWWEPKEDASGL